MSGLEIVFLSYLLVQVLEIGWNLGTGLNDDHPAKFLWNLLKGLVTATLFILVLSKSLV